MRNWRTTAFGFITGLSMILSQVSAVLDSDPATVFSLETCLAALAALGIGFFAKDAGVTGTEK